MELHPDRLFPANEKMRAIARQLYASVKDLPLICPHGHTDPRWFARNEPFSDATSLFVTSDPYILRLLHGHGVPLETVGVPRQDKAEATTAASPRTAWRNFAKHYFLFQGTPSRLWLDAVFQEIFEIERELSVTTADFYFDHIGSRLRQENFRPRALFQRFRIEFLATTDGACDALNHHAEVKSSAWEGRVVPTFRPDVALDPDAPAFMAEIVQLAQLTGENTECAGGYLNALRSRRWAFRDAGATATDHGHATALTANLDPETFSSLYEAAISNRLPSGGAAIFRAHMLTEMARMSIDDGLVMQFHVGAWRGYNNGLVARYGSARGESVPQQTNFVEGLKPLLDRFGNEANFRLILFTLDETAYSRELGPLAGLYPSVWLGSPWWFHDSIEGFLRYRQQATETAGFYKYAGFVDDTRAFFSIPARHDVARRLDAAYLANSVATHRLTESAAFDLISQFASDLPRKAYRLDGA